ncbi:hypothetical protein AB1A81_10785 [Bdellovibrio bacteriovorus]|uniref:Uncharacterized protein n=1 Tax=Bdellovibrio bacteriovorus (strain ATCC 15356 / DSM 50701 / NCIMB 9529 / HD100) TaxID=264462 RepID=Q6MKN5_BDEBA|nr:hypothetical protein [Bdellovibrio bacteriovorus]BEV68767.1 hypothetical protein Bb109J_c2187 [Bdellovibrio bacteriovorus]CAE80172.1 hypothetical protein predicted by Glimmer/Critica [Bdellovibrio bacteriovorus HD100]
MIVLAWFILITLIILFSFGFLGATFWHWYKEGKAKRKAAAVAAASVQN